MFSQLPLSIVQFHEMNPMARRTQLTLKLTNFKFICFS
jgi:hypothetical protein